MPKTATEGKQLDSYLQWMLHQSYCLESSALVKAGANALAAGDSILGRLFVKVSTDWKLIDAVTGAALTTSSVVAICLRTQRLSTAVAANALINDLPGGKNIMLVRGPALIQQEDFEALLPAEVVEATLQTALAALDIRYVTEPGLVFHQY